MRTDEHPISADVASCSLGSVHHSILRAPGKARRSHNAESVLSGLNLGRTLLIHGHDGRIWATTNHEKRTTDYLSDVSIRPSSTQRRLHGLHRRELDDVARIESEMQGRTQSWPTRRFPLLLGVYFALFSVLSSMNRCRDESCI